MPTKKEPTRSSAGMRSAAKKAESNPISAMRGAAETHDEKKTSSTPASKRANAGHREPAPPAVGMPTPDQASTRRLRAKTAAKNKPSPQPSRARVEAAQDNSSVPDKPTFRGNAPVAAPPAGAHRRQPKPAVIDKAAAVLTRITANADIADGSILYLRGEGAGLSWETGVSMNHDGDNKWSWVVESTHQEITFKFLINDQMWSAGDNLTVAQGETSISTPSF